MSLCCVGFIVCVVLARSKLVELDRLVRILPHNHNPFYPCIILNIIIILLLLLLIIIMSSCNDSPATCSNDTAPCNSHTGVRTRCAAHP